MKITVCEGNGQGICSRCGCVAWMPLLCKIEKMYQVITVVIV